MSPAWRVLIGAVYYGSKPIVSRQCALKLKLLEIAV